MTRCKRCQGVGFTEWASFLAGLGNLIGYAVGAPVRPRPCKRCKGTGLEK